MERSLAVLAWLLLASMALAGPNDATWNPPKRFDHPYKGQLFERTLPQPQVVIECRELYVRWGADPNKVTYLMLGCSHHTNTKCLVIYMNQNFGPTTPQDIRRHEIGHCNGWPADHPD